MLTFKRALAIAVAVVTLIFLLRSSHSADSLPRITNANDLPKPKGVHTRLHDDDPVEPVENVLGVPQTTSAAMDGHPPLRKPAPQISLDDMRSRPLKQQLEMQFPYDVTAKFPAYIWQTWKYTPASGEFEEIFREPEASWTFNHPTFVHEVITDSVAAHLIKHLYASFPEVLEAYNALPLPVLKADFFRYLILFARGGIYTDIDTVSLKSAIEWVPPEVDRASYGMVIGIEADPDREDWAQWYSRRIQFCQWTIQAKPGHPILRDVIANITEEVLRRKEKGTLDSKDTHGIIEFTGPAIWTDNIFSYFNNPEYFDMSNSKGNITWRHFTGMTSAKKVGDVVVLPITSFSPGVRQMGAGEDDDPMAFVKHNFEGTYQFHGVLAPPLTAHP
jgi:alpha 1,6-mannosyltransferase